MTMDLQPPLLGRVMAVLRRRWWMMPAGALLLMAGVLVYVLRAEPEWTAQTSVYNAPASEGLSGRRSGLAGLAAGLGGGLGALGGGLGGALGGGLSGSEAAPPFRYFLDGLATPDVAAALAKDERNLRSIFPAEWDDVNKRWRPAPLGLAGGARALVFGVLGLPVPAWTPPGAERLREYIEKNVAVRPSVLSPLTTISHVHPDPVFAARFLDDLVAAADAEVRRAQAVRTAANIDYLSRQLRLTSEADVRLALVDALAGEERSAMLSAVDMPYAAETFSKAAVGRFPSTPRPLPLFAAALFVGVLLGAALALWKGWRETA